MRTFALIALIMLALAPHTAPAQAMQADSVDVEYVKPSTPALQPVYEMMKTAKVLERIRSLLLPLKFPRRLLLKTESCNGEHNAWYDDGVVVVCYEFIDEFWKKVPEKTTARGVTPMDALVAPIVDTFLHEVGHAAFDLWKVPVLGREEDAADFFSAYLMLKFNRQEARRLIMGTAYQYREIVRHPKLSLPITKLANSHSLPAQRFYNVLCIAYGSDQAEFKDLVDKGYLPKERASDCHDEYEQIAYAFETLLKPHIEPGLNEELYLHTLPSPDKQPQRRNAR